MARKTSKTLKATLDATQKDIEDLSRRLRRFLDDNIDSVIRDLQSAKLTGIEAAATIGGLEDTLRAAGLDAIIDEMERPYARQLAYIKSTFNKLGVAGDVFSDADIDVVQTLIDFDTQAVSARLSSHVADVKSTMASMVLGGRSAELDSVLAANDSLESALYSELNTMTQGFAQAVTLAKADDYGFTLFEYIGPDDQVTRPFCEELLGREPAIFTREEIEALDNGQGLPVSIYGGGYNCRHQWRPISEEDARAEGWAP